MLVHGNYKAEKTVTVTIQKNTTSTGTVNVRDTATYNDLLTSLGDLPTSEYGTWKWLNADKIAVGADATVGNATTDDGYNLFYAYFASGDTNYADRYVEIRVKVAKADADLTATANANKSYVEGGYDIASLITVNATYNGNKLNGASFLYYVNGAAESSTKLYGAGTYSIEVVLVHANYKATVATVDVTIDKQKVAVPTVNATAKETYVYTIVDGTAKEHELVLNNLNGLMKYDETKTSVLKATNAGTYYVYVVLNNTDNYEWAEDFDGIIEWKVEKATVLKPNDIKVEYTGSDVITDKLYDTDLYTVSYGTSVIAIGEYKATLTIRPEKFDNYKWNTTDGASVEVIYTIAEKVINWEVSGLDGWEFNTDVDAYTVKATYGESEFEIIKVEFKHEKATEWTEWTENTVPTYAGKYTIRFTLNAHASYTGVTHDVEIEITKATANLPISSLAGKEYDGAAYNTGLTAGSNGIYTISGNVNDAIAKGTYSVTFTLDYVEIGGEKVYNYAWDSSIKTTEDGKVVVNGDTVTLYYSITQATVKVENVTLSDTDNEWTYSGTNGVTINVTTDKEFDGVTFTYIYKFYMMDENGEYQLIPDANEMKDIVNAGKYKVVVTVDGNDNYADGSDATKNFVEFEIKQAQETVTFEYIGGALGTYDAATKTLTLTYRAGGYTVADLIKATLVKSETAAHSGRTTTPSITTVGNAGNYTVTYTYAASTNYAVVTDSIKVVIDPKTIDLGDLDLDKDYTGNKQTSGFTTNDDYTVVDSGRTEFGTWTVTITLNNPEGVTNYVWSDALKAQASDRVVFNGNTLTLSYKITQATVKVTDVTLDKNAWTYDGSNANITKITTDKTFTNVTFTYTYTFYKLEGETWTKLENVTQMSQIVNAGKYKVVVTVNGNDNYADGSDGTANCAVFTIAQKNIEDKTGDSYDISITHEYDGLTYNGSVFEKTVTVMWGTTTLKKDADYTVTITKGNETVVQNAGTYTITITGKGNYEGTRNEVTFTVGKADASITGTPDSVLDATYAPNTSYLANGLFDGVDVKYENGDSTGLRPTVTVVYVPFDGNTTTTTVEYGQTYEIKNAGTYTITYSFANDNFNKVESVVVTIKIAQATETLDSSFSGIINKTYGDDLPTLPESSNGTWSWANGATKVGDYTGEDTRTFTAIFTPGEESKNNYKSNTATVTIKVARATATVTGTAARDLEYTGNAFATENNIGTAITGISAESHNGTFSYSYKHSYASYPAATESVSEIKNAGFYVVTISFVSADNNYAGSTTINVYVEKQSVTHTWTNPTYDNGNDLYLTFSNNTADKTVIEFAADEGTTSASVVSTTGYYANIVLADTNNYKWADNVLADGEGVVFVQWNVAPCPVDLSGITVSDVVYDGDSHNTSFADRYGYEVINTTDAVGVGTYTVKFELASSNFTWGTLPTGATINTSTGNVELTYKITQATVKVTGVTLDKNAWTYGGNSANITQITTDKTFTNVTFSYIYTFYKSVNGAYQLVNGADEMSDITSAGNYKVVVTVNGNSNYTDGSDGTANCAEFTIAQKSIEDKTGDSYDISITHGYDGLTYNGDVFSKTVEVERGNTTTLKEGTDYTVTITKGNENVVKNAGTYTITITGKGNYTGTRTVEFTVAKAHATVTGTAANGLVYKNGNFDIDDVITGIESKKSDGTVLTGEYSYSYQHTYFDDDEDVYENTPTVIKEAGKYKVTISFVSEDGNYAGKVTVYVTINKRTASDVIADILGKQKADSYYYEYQIEELFKKDFIVAKGDDGKPLTAFEYNYDPSSLNTSGKYYQTASITVQNLILNNPEVYSSNNYDTTLAGSAGKDFNFYLVAYIVSGDTTNYYGSIEKALSVASNTNVWVMPISAVDANNPITITNNCTIPNGVTLVLPYGMGEKNASTTATLACLDPEYKYGSTADLNRITLVRVAAGVTLTVNGHLEISGELSGSSGGRDYTGHTAGKYAELQLAAGAKVKVPSTSTSATIKVFGFITEEVQNNSSEVILEAGTLYQPFTFRDYNGGTYMATFASKDNIYHSNSLVLAGIQAVASQFVRNIMESYALSAFNEFHFINVQSPLTIDYNAKMIAWANIYSGDQQNEADINIVGNTKDYLFELTQDVSSFKLKYDKTTGVMDIDIFGGANLNYIELNLHMNISSMSLEFDLKLNTSNIFFPISWAYDISLNPTDKQAKDGEIAQYSFKNRVQLMPGSKFEVAEGAKLTSSNAIYVHMNMANISVGPYNVVIYGDETDTRLPFAYQVDVEDKDENGNGLGTFHKEWRWDLDERYKAAEFIVNGELSVHTLAGQVKSTNPGAIVTITNDTDYALHKVISHSNADKNSTVNSDAPTVYASLYGNAAIPTTGVAYMYNGTSWKYASVTANFETNGGNTITSRPLNYNTTTGYYHGTMPDNPTRTGYTFLGWYMDSAFTTPAIIENGYITNAINSTSITLYAKWVKNEITVEYNTDGGTISGVTDTSLERSDIVSDSNVRYTVTLPTVSKTGYKFLGWYNGSTRAGGSGETYTFVANSLNYTNTVNLTAKWEIIDYTITYQNAVSTHPSFNSTALGLPGTFNANSVNHTLGTPTTDAESWVFTEWYVIKDGVKHTITELSIASVANYADSENKLAIYADWTQETVYTITFVQVVDDVETSISSMAGLECNNITYTASTFDGKSLPNLAGYNSLRSFAYEFKGFELVNGETKTTITRLGDVPETLVGTNFTINVIWTAKYEIEFKVENGLSDYPISVSSGKIFLSAAEVDGIDSEKSQYETTDIAKKYDAETKASKYFANSWSVPDIKTTSFNDKKLIVTATFADKYHLIIKGSMSETGSDNKSYSISFNSDNIEKIYLTADQLGTGTACNSYLLNYQTTTYATKCDDTVYVSKYFAGWSADVKLSNFDPTTKELTVEATWKTKFKITWSIDSTSSRSGLNSYTLTIGGKDVKDLKTPYYVVPNTTITISATAKGTASSIVNWSADYARIKMNGKQYDETKAGGGVNTGDISVSCTEGGTYTITITTFS